MTSDHDRMINFYYLAENPLKFQQCIDHNPFMNIFLAWPPVTTKCYSCDSELSHSDCHARPAETCDVYGDEVCVLLILVQDKTIDFSILLFFTDQYIQLYDLDLLISLS